MALDSTTAKTWKSYSDTVDEKSLINNKAGDETHEAASLIQDSQQMLLQAQKNAEEAKEAALGAISRFYEQSQVSEKKAEKMVRELDEAIEHALTATKNPRLKKAEALSQAAPDVDPLGASLPGKGKKLKLSRKVLNNGPFGAVSALFGNSKDLDPEVKAEFFQYVMRHSPQLRQLIDDLTEDKARIKTERIKNEAKAEIVAARAAVNHAQEETSRVKEEARKAIAEAEAVKRASELVVTQVKQSTIGQAAEEISRAREEVKAVKAAAEIAVRKAEEELAQMKQAAGSASNKAHVTITLAQEKIKKDAEALKNFKLRAKIAVQQAMDEANRLKEEADMVRREGQEAIDRAALESQEARKTMELANKKMQESKTIADRQAYQRFCEEIKVIRNETESNNRMAYEAIIKAREETMQVRHELEMVNKANEEALTLARQEAAKYKAEAQNATQRAEQALYQAREEARRAKEEADAAMLKASETMMQAKQDIISLTRGEISRVRKELEEVSNDTEKAFEYNRAPSVYIDEHVRQSVKLDAHRIATVLHEIRTPLHSIAGFARLMLEEDVTEPATRKEFLSIMVQQSESLNRQIEDLSNILHDNFGLISVDKESVHAAQMISEAIDGVKGISEQKKNLIHRNIPPSLPQIEADALRIKQVIANLLTNAIKYSPERSNILVKADVRGNELLVQVVDRGCGIPEADIPKVFDKYFRGSNHPDVQGMGIGLYVCRQIVEAHGGRIWVESVEGQGSTFSFTLPLPVAG